MQKETIIITVTYWNRWHLLSKVLLSIIKYQKYVKKIIIIDNGSITWSESKKILSKYKDHIIYFRSETNKGAAWWFKKWIEMANDYENYNFLYLLDDDNIPERQAITKLIQNYCKKKKKGKDICLFSRKTKAVEHTERENFINHPNILSFNNNYLFFNVIYIFSLFYWKLFTKKTKSSIYEIDYWPYWWMFLDKETVLNIWLPDESYFLYIDDIEYSNRIKKNKWNLYQVCDSIIFDIDTSFKGKFLWYILYKKNPNLDFRYYYLLRNLAFYQKNKTTNKTIYYINKIIFLLIVSSIWIIFLKFKNLRLFFLAIKDGEKWVRGKSFRN